MTIDELVKEVREEGCAVFSNKTVRDACGLGKLFDSVIEQIKAMLEGRKIALGSRLSNAQNDHVLLYDNAEESPIRRLLDLAAKVKDGNITIYQGWLSRDLERLCKAALDVFD